MKFERKVSSATNVALDFVNYLVTENILTVGQNLHLSSLLPENSQEEQLFSSFMKDYSDRKRSYDRVANFSPFQGRCIKFNDNYLLYIGISSEDLSWIFIWSKLNRSAFYSA